MVNLIHGEAGEFRVPSAGDGQGRLRGAGEVRVPLAGDGEGRHGKEGVVRVFQLEIVVAELDNQELEHISIKL